MNLNEKYKVGTQWKWVYPHNNKSSGPIYLVIKSDRDEFTIGWWFGSQYETMTYREDRPEFIQYDPDSTPSDFERYVAVDSTAQHHLNDDGWKYETGFDHYYKHIWKVGVRNGEFFYEKVK